MIDNIAKQVLEIIDGKETFKEGAYHLRYNGETAISSNGKHIRIENKKDRPGIDVYVEKEAQGEILHIPVVVSDSGRKDLVYNDFYIENGADVTIVAGCGIHNDGCQETRHDGIHAFHVGKHAVVRYEEKHYGEGNGQGGRLLNPKTDIWMEEGASFFMDTSQIKGVDSTKRTTNVHMGAGCRLHVIEKLLTHGEQTAVSDMEILMEGKDSTAQVISRSVAKGNSSQKFHPRAIGKAKCHAHIQCDSIIMEKASVCSIPEIDAQNVDAQIIHEAAIGRINSEQVTKLQTMGMTETEAEEIIIENFLN